jgi:hypothetical protein
MTIEDKEIIVILPLKTWRTIVAHLEVGVHGDVNSILQAIYAQVNPQAIAAEKDAAERVAAEATQAERHTMEALRATEAARAPIQPDPPADDLSDAQSTSRSSALH